MAQTLTCVISAAAERRQRICVCAGEQEMDGAEKILFLIGRHCYPPNRTLRPLKSAERRAWPANPRRRPKLYGSS